MSKFSGEPGIRFNLQDSAKADHYFPKVFGGQTVVFHQQVLAETNSGKSLEFGRGI